MTILLFDIDGTLTESTKKVSEVMISILIKLFNHGYILGIVSGGTYKKIKKQLGMSLLYFKYIFSECGAILHIDSELIYKKNIKKHCDKKVLNKLIKTSLNSISTMPITYGGQHIDFRHGMIYVSPPGVQASNRVRSKFVDKDKKLGLRDKLIDELVSVDTKGQFEIMAGGSVGISITIKGWNKSVAGTYLLENEKVTDTIYYFGDKVLVGGNDYPLYSYPGIVGVAVTDYVDCIKKLVSLFSI